LDAVQRAQEHDIIVTMDADNSHTPGLILRMVRAIDEGCDVVIASRFVSGAQVHGVSLFRRILSRGASLLFQAVLPISGVRDYTCGYRAYRADILRQAFAEYRHAFIEQEGFQCMIDILLKLSLLDLVFGEVPMILRYDLKESSSKMKITSTIQGSLRLLINRRLEFWSRSLWNK
jgi:dolichol-phosphate mannosyltransferase